MTIMSAYLYDYQMFGLLFIGLTLYVMLYYSYCSYKVRGSLPLDLHIALLEFKNKLKEKAPRKEKKVSVSIRIDIGNMIIISIILFIFAWFGFLIQHDIINIKTLGMQTFTWKSMYSYVLILLGIFFLVLGFITAFIGGAVIEDICDTCYSNLPTSCFM